MTDVVHQVPFVEGCLWHALKGRRLHCDPLPKEKDRARDFLSQEKVYTDNLSWNGPTRSFVMEIMKMLSEEEDGDESGGGHPEEELVELLGVDEKTMYSLRQRGMPFTRLNRARRVYLVNEVL